KFEHLDGCLSDPEWCTSGEGAAIYGIAGELWRAVKEARSDGIPWCLCHEFDNNPACKSCSVRSICKQRTDAITAQATAAENKRVLEELFRWMREDIKLTFVLFSSGKMMCVERYNECQFNAELLYLKLNTLRLAQPEQKEREPE
ncbi:MAG: hypothetical protein M0Q91_18685, partial [Methanoregula sp.]|nr:hypothetical protein [Methanoregula sp.]